MILLEIFQDAVPGYQSPDQDQSAIKLSDLRKTRLTLSQIQTLRKMSDTRRVEKQRELTDIRQQFAPKRSE